MNTYFTSDTHFSHKAIIGYCNRPFVSVDEMNEVLINNWNNKVSKTDEIYILGDFSFAPIPKTIEILGLLNGKKILVAGNHDTGILNNPNVKKLFNETFEQQTRKFWVNGKLQKIVLSHYPMKTWDSKHHGSWQLFGHVHSQKHLETEEFQLDVGVDANDYTPLSLEDIADIMAKRSGGLNKHGY